MKESENTSDILHRGSLEIREATVAKGKKKKKGNLQRKFVKLIV